ncbi:MAG: glutathione S-transferase [Okeania sp. SIO2G4]|nr:glutathione S-transferase [Okeania sp. SIO2H7]NEP74568.1 glutathione S-transferase [Okeania sp. SIO2G5]NEP95629.1 glutathione S-transferase [Okeania sp. SIO2F5]NEQ94548.1 glutathione S-transferase [Okeania sp. SIO2G4]
MKTETSQQKSLPEWEELLEVAQQNTTAKWISRPGQTPATATISSHLHRLSPGEKPSVLLYRDTHGWCPFCERVWFALEEKQIPFETELIDLSNKPQWYKDMVPTALVPAVKIEGELVYESKDILLALEKKFDRFPLLPIASQERSAALDMIENFDANGLVKSGYAFLRGKPANSEKSTETIPEQIAAQLLNLQTTFETKLDQLELLLGQYPGVYFMGEFSLVDIMYTPAIRRFAANLPVFRGYSLYDNDRFPRLNQWLTAINKRSSYQRIKPSARTNNLIMHKLFGVQPIHKNKSLSVTQPQPHGEVESQTEEYSMEAAARLSSNYQTVIADIIKNSGIKKWVIQETLPSIELAIERHLRRLVHCLIEGSIPLFSDKPVDSKTDQQNEEKEESAADAAVGAIALAFLRNRVCVPRDMSAGAAVALETTIDAMLSSIY